MTNETARNLTPQQRRLLRILGWVGMVLLLLLLAAAVAADVDSNSDGDASESNTDIELTLGAWDSDLEGSPDQVAEYEPLDGGPHASLVLHSTPDWGQAFLSAHVRDSDDYDLRFDFDVRRSVRSTTEATGLIHRLGHTPLDIYAAATNHGRVVQHTDLAPGDVYDIAYSSLRHRTEVQPRGNPSLTLGVDYRLQERDGLAQAITVSHCDTCHVTSQSRIVDETTQEAGLDALVTWMSGSLRASFLHRELRDDAPPVTYVFDDALQPELRIPIFDERLQYDSAEGPQVVHQPPELTKDVGKVRLAFFDVGGFSVQTGLVWAQTENDRTGLAADYRGVSLDAARALPNDWRLRWRGRAYDIDNDDVFVDVNERPGIAGPARGQTFSDRYGLQTDFLRESSLNRQVVESKLDVSHRFGKQAGTLRFHWDFESVDRDHYEVAVGETETVENVLGVAWRGRPSDDVRLSASLRHGEVDDPFALVDGAYSTLVSVRVATPFDPRAAQYFEFHEARIADTTASPESWDELRLGLSWVLSGGDGDGGTTLTASYRDWDGDNDGEAGDGGLTDWSRTVESANVALWSSPTTDWQWHIAYAHQDAELNFPIFIPIFDG